MPFETLPRPADSTPPPLDGAPICGLILDIDGVLEFQGRPCPGAPETLSALRRMGLRICFLTNSTLKSRASCAARLRQKGFELSEEEVITASSASAAYLRRIKPRSAWVLLEGAGLDEFAGLPIDEEDPEVIVIGDFFSTLNFDTLNQILRRLKRGARLIGMHSEMVDCSAGELELNVGSVVEMLARAARVQPVYIGKPAPFAFELALELLGLERGQVVVVGDQIQTDILGANRSGLRSVLVRNGEFDPRDPLSSTIRPDRTISSVTELPEVISNWRAMNREKAG